MADIYVEEFLWRGRPASSDQPSGYHVILGSADTVFGQLKVTFSDPMTAAEAAKAGFPLDTIVANINSAMTKERDDAIAAKTIAETSFTEAVSNHEEAIAARDQAIAERDKAVADLDAMKNIVEFQEGG